MEKELAPPLPQKKRFHTLSSKQAKEVENLTERQRWDPGSGTGRQILRSWEYVEFILSEKDWEFLLFLILLGQILSVPAKILDTI